MISAIIILLPWLIETFGNKVKKDKNKKTNTIKIFSRLSKNYFCDG